MTNELRRFLTTERSQEHIENEEWINLLEDAAFKAYPLVQELFLVLKRCGAWAKYYDVVRTRVKNITDKLNMEFAKFNIPITCNLYPCPTSFGSVQDIDFLADPQTFNDEVDLSLAFKLTLNTLLYNKSRTKELQDAFNMFIACNRLTIYHLCGDDSQFEIQLNGCIKYVRTFAQELVQKQLI